MSIRFKFRSSLNFDSLDIDGRPYISVRDLRSKIVRLKHLNICQDFDLVFSDAVTGQDFKDDNYQVPNGSSVIIKRIPAGAIPSAVGLIDSVEKFGRRIYSRISSDGCQPVTKQMDKFDDFGVDLCPASKEFLNDCGKDEHPLPDKNRIGNEKKNFVDSRCLKFEASDLSEATPQGTHENILQMKLEDKIEKHMEIEKVANTVFISVPNINFPSELKCSLCHTFFKEAVMIPCCQHSFCEKCIRAVLLEKASCPKCSSSKCRIEDLLPNLSLRQAIEHFLEVHNFLDVSDIGLRKDVPDGESGIQGEGVPRGLTSICREPDLAYSPSATERGSNQIMLESVYESVKQTVGRRDGYDAAVTDFQGESEPVCVPAHEEANFNAKKRKHFWQEIGGGDRNITTSVRKGDRTCYMCGSPDHFIRDCPFASSTHPVFQAGTAMLPRGIPGYTLPYWNASAFPHMGPLSNFYGSPGMVPFNPTMMPVAPMSVPPYFPSMYCGFPGRGAVVGVDGSTIPIGARAELPPNYSQLLEVKGCDNKGLHRNEILGSGKAYDGKDCDFLEETERSRRHRHRMELENVSYSEDSFTDKSGQKHRHNKHLDHDVPPVNRKQDQNSRFPIDGRDRKPYLPERSSSGVEDLPTSSGRSNEERHKYHHRSSNDYHDRNGQYDTCNSRTRHRVQKEKDDKKRSVESYFQGPNKRHQRQSESDLDRSHSFDKKKRCKENGCSKRSCHSCNHTGHDLCTDRWQMAGGLDEDCSEVHHHHKQRIDH